MSSFRTLRTAGRPSSTKYGTRRRRRQIRGEFSIKNIYKLHEILVLRCSLPKKSRPN